MCCICEGNIQATSWPDSQNQVQSAYVKATCPCLSVCVRNSLSVAVCLHDIVKDVSIMDGGQLHVDLLHLFRSEVFKLKILCDVKGSDACRCQQLELQQWLRHCFLTVCLLQFVPKIIPALSEDIIISNVC